LSETYYWYDYETTGIDPSRDRVIQFAGIRTDLDFNLIAEPDVFYCKLHDDVLPHPEACLVTGISPQLANEKGLLEPDFITRVNQQFSTPQTCVVGYNSIRFDDEFTRHLLYRNFFDPYAREWKSGNSRWDLIDVVRMTYALRPEGINWPVREGNLPSFKLEELTKANGITHESAHDALSDVYATIALAKLIKQKQPKLFAWGYALRNKKKASDLLDVVNHTTILHISSKYPASQKCLGVVCPLVQHPINKNAIIVVDLTVDPTDLINLTSEDIYKRLYTATAALKEGELRIPLKAVHLNKSPMLAPLGTLNETVKDELQIDLSQCEINRQAILQAKITKKIVDVFLINEFKASSDPDLMLYGGGFFSQLDVRNMAHIRDCTKEELVDLDLPFEDERLTEMLFRYRARNYPETLTETEKKSRDMFRYECLTKENNDGRLTLMRYFDRLDELIAKEGWSEKQQILLEDLVNYGEQISESLNQQGC